MTDGVRHFSAMGDTAEAKIAYAEERWSTWYALAKAAETRAAVLEAALRDLVVETSGWVSPKWRDESAAWRAAASLVEKGQHLEETQADRVGRGPKRLRRSPTQGGEDA